MGDLILQKQSKVHGAMAILLLTTAFAHAGVTVSKPTNNATVSSSMQVVAAATPSSSSYRISAMQVYVNSTKVYATTASSINQYFPVKAGSNKLQVKAWDSSGKEFVTTLYVTSGSGDGSPSGSGDASKIADIDHLTGWGSCDGCAGKDASGPDATYWMKQFLSTPSLDGKSIQFHLGGTTPYANAVWWKRLITDSSKVRGAKHFIFDLYFYYKNAHAAQGFEFNISQYFDGKAFIYGMQCNVRSGSGPHWDVSWIRDFSQPRTLTNMAWKNTGVACPAPPTYSWNHVTLEAERTSDNQVHFISITLNGKKSYLDLKVPYRIAPSDWMGVNVHYQMNGNYQQEDWDSWVDKFSLTSW